MGLGCPAWGADPTGGHLLFLHQNPAASPEAAQRGCGRAGGPRSESPPSPHPDSEGHPVQQTLCSRNGNGHGFRGWSRGSRDLSTLAKLPPPNPFPFTEFQSPSGDKGVGLTVLTQSNGVTRSGPKRRPFVHLPLPPGSVAPTIPWAPSPVCAGVEGRTSRAFE